MRILSPPLSIIESNLFAPSLGLVRRWIDGDPSLSADDRASLVADEGACVLRREWEAMQTGEDEPVTMAPVPVPPHIGALVQQRVETLESKLSPVPRPGLIVRVDEAIGPEGPLGWDMAQPFAVVLSEPTEQPEIWYGWLMSWETDYAGPWDLLLDEGDQPYDPLAAMVQTWNPVHLYVRSLSAPLGQLSPERVAVLRDLANDIGDEQPDASDADPGTLVQRTTSGGHLVLTGSPMGNEDDPRWRYQQLYFEAAGLLRAVAQHARQPLGQSAPQPWWVDVLDRLKSAAGAVGIPVIPVAVAALGEDTSAAELYQPHRLGDLVELRLIPSPDGDAIQLHLTLLRDAPIVVGVARGERVRQQARLMPDAAEADLFVGADEGLTLFIRDDSGAFLFSTGIGNGRDHP